jgi:uncharacterized membrane protein
MDAAANAPPPGAARLESVDRLRGLVIVIMALDHMRDFFDADALRFSPTDLSHTYLALFLTRFITHYCAPTFTLLAGVSAWLRLEKLGSRAQISQFLFTRGLWLVLLDALLISPVWTLQFGKIELGTLWAIGGGMMALSALVFLPARAVLLIGATILATHNLFDSIHAADFGAYGAFWSLLHEPGPLPFGLPGKVLYPVLPWIGVIALGYGLGPWFSLPAPKRDALLPRLGVAALAAFLLLRGFNLYGDPHPWSAQATPTLTALSFLNVTKYPPSLLYALVTLGPALLLLAPLEQVRGAFGRMLGVFGATPLFFYVLHLYVGGAAAMALAYARGFRPADIGAFFDAGGPPANFGVGLAGAYVAWIAVVAALYPLCAWFAGVKRKRRDWWLSYL